jgi:hypothetical protein
MLINVQTKYTTPPEFSESANKSFVIKKQYYSASTYSSSSEQVSEI